MKTLQALREAKERASREYSAAKAAYDIASARWSELYDLCNIAEAEQREREIDEENRIMSAALEAEAA